MNPFTLLKACVPIIVLIDDLWNENLKKHKTLLTIKISVHSTEPDSNVKWSAFHTLGIGAGQPWVWSLYTMETWERNQVSLYESRF